MTDANAGFGMRVALFGVGNDEPGTRSVGAGTDERRGPGSRLPGKRRQGPEGAAGGAGTALALDDLGSRRGNELDEFAGFPQLSRAD
jgi:hypothetical protein